MDSISVSSLITGFASGIISSVLTYFSTRSKIRLDMRVEYDKTLHNERLELYNLKGYCKTGHTGSLQNRPWEGSRNLDVVPFRSLFGQV
jgi:hypothetical protein